MTISKMKAKKILVLFTLAALSAASAYGIFQNKSSAAGFFGAIYTTTFDGQTVNENLYSVKDAVYLSGGPQNANANGLPDGTYYFQVTDPSGGTLLSTDLAECRQLIVANGRVAASDGPACQHPTGIPNSANGSTPVKLAPFNTTPNSAGEYKVWLIRQAANTTVAGDGMRINFNNNNAKTDNFKVIFVPCTNCSPTSTLSGKKFYDANHNRSFDQGEAPVGGVQIAIDITISDVTSTTVVTTDESGNWNVVVPTGSGYQVGEIVPYTGPDEPDSYWAQTAPAADGEGFQGYGGTANGNRTGLNFGNICYGPNGVASETPCSVSYETSPPPSPTPTPEATPTPTPCEDCPTVTLSGTKFYDANANGVYNDGEVTVQGVRIAVVLTVNGDSTTTVVTTNADGNWSLVVPTGADYIVGEYVPDTDSEEEPGSYWEQTAPAADDEGFRGYRGTASENQSGLNFGDNCFHPDSEGNPVASATPCTVSYPVRETPTEPTPTPTPDNW
jgi:hypothetical protein